jgi:hypothetical protein
MTLGAAALLRGGRRSGDEDERLGADLAAAHLRAQGLDMRLKALPFADGELVPHQARQRVGHLRRKPQRLCEARHRLLVALQALQQHAEVVMGLGEPGIGRHDLLQIRQRLRVASQVPQHVGDVVVGGGRSGVEPRRLEKHRQGISRPALVNQRHAQGVVRVDEVRVRGDLAPQELLGLDKIAEGEMAVAQAVASPFARRLLHHLAERRERLAKPVLE